VVRDDVRVVVERYLQLVDCVLPGQIQGLYLVGSAALRDYRPGKSDVDFVALAETPLSMHDLDGLEVVHRELAAEIPKPWFDGIYVTWADLACSPTDIEHVPFTHQGTLQRRGDSRPIPPPGLPYARTRSPFAGRRRRPCGTTQPSRVDGTLTISTRIGAD
jgi:hypothetical protein